MLVSKHVIVCVFLPQQLAMGSVGPDGLLVWGEGFGVGGLPVALPTMEAHRRKLKD